MFGKDGNPPPGTIASREVWLQPEHSREVADYLSHKPLALTPPHDFLQSERRAGAVPRPTSTRKDDRDSVL